MTTEIKVTVENLAPENGANLLPIWIAVHDGSFDIFDEGAMASSGIELIAEDGVTGLETNIPNFFGTALSQFFEDGGNLADLRAIVPNLINSGLDLSQIQPLVQQFNAAGFNARNLLSTVQQLNNSGLDLSEVLPTFETLIDSGFDLTTLEPIFEELANSDLDSETILLLLEEVANSGLNTGTLFLVFQELTEAGVDTNAFLPALQELADVGLDLETLQPLFDIFADPNLDVNALASALQGVDLETVLPLIQELLNLGSELSDLPATPGTIAASFSESEAAANGGIQDLVFGEEESFFSLPSGATSETTIVLDDSNSTNRFFSYASMVFPSNDAFIGNEDPEEIPIFDAEGNFIGADFIILGNQVWDAGTEVNDEDPTTVPIAFDTFFQSVDENGTIQLHPGLLPPGSGGIVDSTDSVNADFSAPGYQIARITISEVINESVVNPQDDSEIIVFGDSLSDTGNSFAVTGIPPSPPYFEGRVSNGIVAVEILANQLGLNFDPNDNFAFAGATTGRDNTNDDNTGLDLPGLLDQIDEFAARVGAEGADEDALYIIWAGANDFSGLVDGVIPEDPTAFITDSITNLVTAISSLEALGAQEIVVPNLPNLGLIPGSDELENEATTLTIAFNSALESALDNLDFETTLVDFFSISNAVAQNPADFGFTNISDPLLFQFPTPPNPEEFFFWDTFHPTTQGHAIFAETIEQTLLGEPIQPFVFSSELDANQEVAPSESLATGTAQLRLNELGTSLNYSLTVSGLDFGVLAGIAPQTPETGDDVTMLHFHNAPRGANGDVVFGIINPNQDDDDLNITINADGSTTISGIWEESDSANQPLSEFVTQLRQAQSGEDVDLYFNVHTQDSPTGAIRGQITAGELPAPNPIPNLIVDENNIFSLIDGSEEIALEFTLAGVDAGNVNEIYLVRFDDASGTVNGVTPDNPDYLEALASESQVIFSALNSLSQDFLNSRNFFSEDLRRVIPDFESGDNFGLFLTPQTTLNAVVENTAESEVLLGFGDISFLDVNQLDDGFFQLNWEDETNGDVDFNDLTVTLRTTTDNTLGTGLQGNSEGELIDLRNQAGELLRTTIRATGNASLNNVGGLYLVLDEQGTVFDPITGTFLTPENPEYAAVAVNQSIIEFDVIDPNPITIAGGFIYAPYLLINGDEEAFSSPFTLANANGVDQLRLLGDNTFAFEDSLDGGDSSFDDFIFQVDLALV